MATSSSDSEWASGPGFFDSCGSESRSSGLKLGITHPEGSALARRLVSTIEGEVIPRLMLVRTPPALGERTAASSVELSSADVRPDISDVESLTRLLLSHDVDVAAAFLNSLKTAGVPSDRILLHLLAPAARRLGDLWDDDVADFTQVTVGLFRLHQLLRRIAPEAPPATEAREFGRRALLVPFPGEQHTFGLWLVAEFMRRNGWYVRNEPVASASSVVEMVRAEWFACIGITVANESQVEKLGTLIQSVRRASRNHAIGVLVGGPLLLARPEIAALVGADATATDARHAVAQAESVCKWLEVGPGEGHPLAGTPVR